MRNLVVLTIVVAFFGFGTVGCKSMKSRCEKMVKLMKEDSMMKKMIEKKGEADFVKECVEKGEKEKKDKPKKFECGTKCIDDGNSLKDIMTCMDKCK